MSDSDSNVDQLHRSRLSEASLQERGLKIEDSNGPLDKVNFVVWLEPIHAKRVSNVIAGAMQEAVWPGDEVRNESLDEARARADYQLVDAQNVASWEDPVHYAACRIEWGLYHMYRQAIAELQQNPPADLSARAVKTHIVNLEYRLEQLQLSPRWDHAIMYDRNADAIRELSAPTSVPGAVKHLVIGGTHNTLAFQDDLRQMADREGLTYAIVGFIDKQTATPEEVATYAAYSIAYYQEHRAELHQLADPYLVSISTF